MRTRRASTSCLFLITGVLFALPTAASRADEPSASAEQLLERIAITDEGSSSKSTRDEAAGQIPLRHLPHQHQATVQQIVNSSDMFRRLPTLTFEVEPRVYQFFLQHPDVAVSIWRSLNVSEYQMSRTGPSDFQANSGDGTLGQIEVLYQNANQQVILCDGEFRSPLIKKKLRARAVLHLIANERQTPDGRMFVSHRLDMFVHFPSDTFGAAVKLAKPVSNIVIDRNFREVSLFVQMMSLAMQSRPDWVENLASSLDGVHDTRKQELVTLTAHVFVGNQERLKAEQERAAAAAAQGENRVASRPSDAPAMR